MSPAPRCRASEGWQLEVASERAHLYAGALHLSSPSVARLHALALVRARVARAFERVPDRLEWVHERLDVHAFFRHLTRARALLAEDAEIASAWGACLEEVGVTSTEFLVDRPRLRGVAPGGHRETVTHAAYALHRDTWYANPPSQINLWIPLRDVDEGDGLRIYRGAFSRAVPNDSSAFDYARWGKAVGFQNAAPPPGAVYPSATEAHALETGPASVLPVSKGGLLAFSGAHLHGPQPHDAPQTRFSVDLRVVHRGDHAAGLGAKRLDNKSRGDASLDYAFWPAWEAP